jgi:hypothetical protein
MIAAILSLTLLGAALGIILGSPTSSCRSTAIRWSKN